MNKNDLFGIWCTRAESSQFGSDQDWLLSEGERIEYPALEIAQEIALELNRETRTSNVAYQAKRIIPILTPLSDTVWPVMHEEPLYFRHGISGRTRTSLLDTHKMIVNERDEIINVVTENYSLIQHGDFANNVIDMIPKEFGNWEPKLWISPNDARMTLDIKFPEITCDIERNDPVSPTLEIKHSHDGYWAQDLLLGAFRFKCSNGLVIGKQIFHQHKKHIGKGEFAFPQLNEDLKKSMADFFIQTKEWKQWQGRITTYDDYERVMIALQLGKRAMAEIEQTVEVSSNQKIEDLKLKTLNYWMFYNIITAYVTHKVESPLRKADLQARMRRIF